MYCDRKNIGYIIRTSGLQRDRRLLFIFFMFSVVYVTFKLSLLFYIMNSNYRENSCEDYPVFLSLIFAPYDVKTYHIRPAGDFWGTDQLSCVFQDSEESPRKWLYSLRRACVLIPVNLNIFLSTLKFSHVIFMVSHYWFISDIEHSTICLAGYF